MGRLTEKWMCCSAEKREQTLALPAALTVAAGAALSSPLAAQAGVTPSLKNLINSVIAGMRTCRSSLLLNSVPFLNLIEIMHVFCACTLCQSQLQRNMPSIRDSYKRGIAPEAEANASCCAALRWDNRNSGSA